jgi:hypothetical protein
MVADVPAYVTNPAFVQNGVKVQAGNNWEFSRGAVPTPIVTLPDPEPVRPAVVEAPASHSDPNALPGCRPGSGPYTRRNGPIRRAIDGSDRSGTSGPQTAP